MGSTKQRGDVSELAAMKKYRELGWKILVPFGDDCRFDFLAYKNEDGIQSYRRVQVKTARTLENGSIRAELKSTNYKNSECTTKKYKPENIDVFLIYSPDYDEVLEVSSHIDQEQITIRFEDPKKKDSNINWAEDYIVG